MTYPTEIPINADEKWIGDYCKESKSVSYILPDESVQGGRRYWVTFFEDKKRLCVIVSNKNDAFEIFLNRRGEFFRGCYPEKTHPEVEAEIEFDNTPRLRKAIPYLKKLPAELPPMMVPLYELRPTTEEVKMGVTLDDFIDSL
ncbi:hypothetical protein ACFLZN_02215 [Nanoarchaeota archaeon]